jgi:hypothetical protein
MWWRIPRLIPSLIKDIEEDLEDVYINNINTTIPLIDLEDISAYQKSKEDKDPKGS